MPASQERLWSEIRRLKAQLKALEEVTPEQVASETTVINNTYTSVTEELDTSPRRQVSVTILNPTSDTYYTIADLEDDITVDRISHYRVGGSLLTWTVFKSATPHAETAVLHSPTSGSSTLRAVELAIDSGAVDASTTPNLTLYVDSSVGPADEFHMSMSYVTANPNVHTKSITIVNPQSSTIYSLFDIEKDCLITKISHFQVDGTSVPWTLMASATPHGTDQTIDSGTSLTTRTLDEDVLDGNIVSTINPLVSLHTGTIVGSPTELHMTIYCDEI